MATKSQTAISIVTGILLVYVVAASLPISFAIVYWLFLISTGGLLWMVLKILKDKSDVSTKTFDTHFYEDADPK
jgi:hypothetical protein